MLQKKEGGVWKNLLYAQDINVDTCMRRWCSNHSFYCWSKKVTAAGSLNISIGFEMVKSTYIYFKNKSPTKRPLSPINVTACGFALKASDLNSSHYHEECINVCHCSEITKYFPNVLKLLPSRSAQRWRHECGAWPFSKQLDESLYLFLEVKYKEGSSWVHLQCQESAAHHRTHRAAHGRLIIPYTLSPRQLVAVSLQGLCV